MGRLGGRPSDLGAPSLAHTGGNTDTFPVEGDGRRFVVIATNPTDADSFLVEEALRRKGVHVELAHLSDFPSRSTASLYLDPDEDQVDRWHLFDQPPGEKLRRPDTVWWRRPGPPVVPSDVHPEDKEFVRQETSKFVVGLWQHLPQSAVYVNSPAHAFMADRKPYQLRIARELGFTIPPTLFSNNPAEIRSAIRRWGGRAIYKPFGQINNFWWDSERERMLGLFTTALDEGSIPDDQTLSLTPGIYQPMLPKSFELRVTVFGSAVFATKIFSQEQEQSQIDWRRIQRTLRYEAVKAPAGLRKLCVSMLRRLGLLMGCFDFVVTPHQSVVFLEVNESGQFLWQESVSGAPILDAFSDFLVSPRAGFRWKPSAEPLKIEQIRAIAADRKAQAAATHQVPEIPAYLKASLAAAERHSTEEKPH